MGLSNSAQNLLIAGLAVAAVGASGYAVWNVNQPHPSLTDSHSSAAATVPATGDDAAARDGDAQSTAAESTAGATADPLVTVDAGTETAEATEQPSEDDEPSVQEWVDAWSDEADLLVIGDGYSNMPRQWVQLWARQVGVNRPVQIHHWGESADAGFNEPIILSSSGDEPLTVWSAGRAGSTVQAAADRYDRFVNASAEPDAVLITLGLSSANEDIGAGLDALLGKIDDGVPVLISVGPEGLYESGVSDSFLEWAQDNDDRVSVVDLRDVAPATPTAEQWARAFQQALDAS